MRRIPLLLFMALLLVPMVQAATAYTITLTATIDELEVTYTTLLTATCVDGSDVSHEDNVTFTIDGIAFIWNEATGYYYGKDTESTPTTNTYDTLDLITDTGDGAATGSINQTATVTWLTSLQTTIFNLIAAGDLPGATIQVITTDLGSLFFFTFIIGSISVAVYSLGAEIMLLVWI